MIMLIASIAIIIASIGLVIATRNMRRKSEADKSTIETEKALRERELQFLEDYINNANIPYDIKASALLSYKHQILSKAVQDGDFYISKNNSLIA